MNTGTGKITFIIPTRDRPDILQNCLQSISAQAEYVGQVIVVASGLDVGDAVAGFSDTLPLTYIHSEVAGQVVQRNIGRREIAGSTELVGFLDDDINLGESALKNMLDFWSETDERTAGAGFNLVSDERHPHPVLYSLLKKVTGSVPGSVNRFGVSVPFNNTSVNRQTQFLGGGYTVWRRDILEEFAQSDILTRWAQGEDLRISYPIGRKYPLYVCADAKVYQGGEQKEADDAEMKRYRARITALSQLYFVSQHRELSTGLAMSLLICKTLVNMVTPRRRDYGIGQFQAAVLSLRSRLNSDNLLDLLNEY